MPLPTPVLQNKQAFTNIVGQPGVLFGISPDRRWIFGQGTSPFGRRVSVRDLSSDTSEWKNLVGASGSDFGSTPRNINGVVMTNDGELLVTTTSTTVSSYIYKTRGLNLEAGTFQSFDLVLETGGPEVSFRREWSFGQHSVAPAWHPMAGSALFMEYGATSKSVTAAGRPLEQTATHAWFTRDNGETWAKCFDAKDKHPGATLQLHGHGGTALLADNAWIVVGGDGTSAADSAGSWAYICNDEDLESSGPWTLLPGSAANSGQRQVVSVREGQDCILFGSDSAPARIARASRLGYRRYGPMTTLTPIDPSGLIAGPVWRNQNEPDAPIFAAFPSNSLIPAIFVSLDGGQTFTEGYRHDVAMTGGNGISFVVGPDVRGRVWCAFYNGTDSTLLRFDFVPPLAI